MVSGQEIRERPPLYILISIGACHRELPMSIIFDFASVLQPLQNYVSKRNITLADLSLSLIAQLAEMSIEGGVKVRFLSTNHLLSPGQEV